MRLQEFFQKFALSEGNQVSVLTKKQQILEGTLIPSNDEGILALKLKNGYNAGIKVEEVSEIKKISEGKTVGKPPVKEIQKDSKKPTIAILHTGGTIASRVDYATGAVYASFNEKDLLTMFPELSQKANIVSEHLSNMWSDDMRFAHYAKMAKAIEKHASSGVAGIIIGHGTDTLGYSAAALAFMLEGLNIPVLLVGAQRSSDRGSSDAAMNLECAAEFILNSDFAGVAVCMHDSSSDSKCAILPACKMRKLHSSRRDAFKAVNDTPIALVDYNSKKIDFLKENFERKSSKKKLVVKEKMEDKVAILKVHTNMSPEQVRFFEKQEYKGLVIEGTGLGQMPGFIPDDSAMGNKGIIEAVESLTKSGCVVVMTTQCIFGRVQMHVYDKGVKLIKVGVIPGEDMLAETAFVKLAWLLGQYPKSPEKVKELMVKNLRGEITERTNFDEDFAKEL
ncbi:MAG: Glu-tRNA(Gln) amidotransferase subunit GatD [Candidatus Diapherotrites archaeon]|nr:Glu-tRNA(Gln) amidotransferase subunit GatD [Candidatus Diapherotrites archaeon]